MGLSRRALCWWPAGWLSIAVRRSRQRRRAAARARARPARQPSRRDRGRRRASRRAGRRGASTAAALRTSRTALTLDFDALLDDTRGRGGRADGRGRRRAPGRGPRRTAGHRNGRPGARVATSPSRRWRRSRRGRSAPRRSTGRTAPRESRTTSRSTRHSSRRSERSAGVPGTLVAYSTAPHAFRPEHAIGPERALAEVATGLANARRFADVEARLLLDPATGVANRRGYEVELGREVARATRTGRPLSVVLVGISNGSDTTTTGSPGAPTSSRDSSRA